MTDKTQGVTSGVVVPLLQAVVTGLLLAGAAVSVWYVYQVRDALRLFLAALACGTFLAWLGSLGHWRRWVDAALGITQPEQGRAPYELRLSLDYNDHQAGDMFGLGVDYQALERWCAGVSSGGSLGENHWCGSRAPFSKGEYHKFLAELVKRGYVRAKGRYHAQGYELTGKGRALAGELSRRYHARLSPSERRYHPGLRV